MKELSALFLSQERFKASLQEVAEGSVESVRLFHNEPAHTASLLTALAQPQCRVHSLDIYTLDASPESAGALQRYLSSKHVCRIRSLTVHSCQGMPAALALGAGLGASCCTVEQLSLTGLSDGELAATLRPILQRQQGSVTTRTLTLTRCHLGSEAASWLAVCSHLQELHLADCVLPDGIAEQLVQQAWLQSAFTSHLHVLSFCGTQIGVQTATAIGHLLAHPSGSQLSTLCLNNSSAINDQAAEALSHGVRANRCIKQLQLCQCGIGPAGAQALASALTSHPTLEELSLDNNHIGAQGMMALLQAACQPSNTQPDDEQHDIVMAEQDVQPLAASSATVLRTLRMESNGIKGSELPSSWPAGQADMGQQQQQQLSCGLQVLSVAHNFVSDAGTQMLQQVLRHAHHLIHLNLEGCGVGPTGAAALVVLLQEHPQLRDLRLDHNRLHDAGGRLLLDAVQAHPGLHVFRADACRLLDVELKARLAELTMQLAARASQNKQASENKQAAVKVRPGTRFPAAVYQRHTDMEHDAAGSTASAAGSSHSQVQPQGSIAAAARGPRRIGSRFSRDAYQRPMQLDDDDDDRTPTAPQPGSARALGEGVEQQLPTAGDKHLLGFSEREDGARPVKFKDADREREWEGGGSPGGRIPSASQNIEAVHPFRDDGGKCWGRLSDDIQHGSMSSWGHSSMSTCSRSSSQSLSPTSAAGYGMAHSYGSGSHTIQHGLCRMVSEGNHSSAPAQALQSASSVPVEHRPGHAAQAQPGVYLVLRPSTKKKRSYKPLTPQQQALFDVF